MLHSYQLCRRDPVCMLNSIWYFQYFFFRCSDNCVVINQHSLITNEVQHLFMCLLAIHIASLVKCLFMPFAHFLIGLFLLLYILNWSDIWFANNSLNNFLLLKVLQSKSFSFWWSPIYQLFLLGLCFRGKGWEPVA